MLKEAYRNRGFYDVNVHFFNKIASSGRKGKGKKKGQHILRKITGTDSLVKSREGPEV